MGGNAPKDIDGQSVHLSNWVHLLRKGWAAGAIPDLVRTTGWQCSEKLRPASRVPCLFVYNRVLFGWFYSEIIIGFLGAFAPKSPNRQIAKDLKISRDKTNEYVRMAELDSLDLDALLRLDDPVLEKRFHPGNPAYSDSRMGTFLELLPDFVEQLSHKHVTRQLVWEEYKRTHPDGYEKSQFYFHLAQNLKARKTPTSVLQHDPGKELFVDFAGDTLGYVDVETGELIRVQTFISHI